MTEIIGFGIFLPRTKRFFFFFFYFDLFLYGGFFDRTVLIMTILSCATAAT